MCERAGERAGRIKLTRETKSSAVWLTLKLKSGKVGPVYGTCKPAKIAVTKNPRIQAIDRLVVETFHNGFGNIQRPIQDALDRASLITNDKPWELALMIDNELWANVASGISKVDMPPVGAQGKPLDPLRTVNGSVRPLIGCLRYQERVSANEHFDIVLGGQMLWITDLREDLGPCRRQFYYCRRMKRFSVAAAQG